MQLSYDNFSVPKKILKPDQSLMNNKWDLDFPKSTNASPKLNRSKKQDS